MKKFVTHSLEFEKLIRFDAGQAGVSLSVELRLGKDAVVFDAKLDTGSSFCIFEMVYFAEDDSFNRNVLGRRGAIENLKIGLIDYDGKLYLSRYESE